MRKDGNMSIRRLMKSRWALFASILLCAFIFFQTIKVVSKGAATDKEIAALKKESKTLVEEQKKLEQLQRFLQTDYFAESEARTKLGYKKEGETAIIIVENSKTEYSSDAPQKTNGEGAVSAGAHNEKERGFADLWWGYFFGTQRK